MNQKKMNKYHYFIMPFELDKNWEMKETEKKEHFITVIAKDINDSTTRLNQYLDNNGIKKCLTVISDENSKLSDFKNQIKEWAIGGNIDSNIFK